MAQFLITGPDGKKYKVTGDNAEGALNALKSTLGSSPVPINADSSPLEKMRNPEFRKQWLAEHPNAFKDVNGLGTTGDAAATLLQGVPFVGEYADEALGAIAPLVGQNDAATATQAIRSGQERFQRENPKTGLGLKIAGGVAGTLPAIAAAPAVASFAPATMGPRILYGTGLGGTLGGLEGLVSGWGSGTDAESRKGNAVTRGGIGAGLGILLGAAAPVLKEGITRAGRWTLDQFNVAREARAAGLSRPSYEILTRAMDADQSLSGAGAQRLAAAGPNAMLADAGPSARSILDTTIQKSGPAGRVAQQAVEGRASQASGVAQGALDRALGRASGVGTSETAIRQGSSAARQAAYNAAYSAPINYASPAGRQLETMMRRVPGDVINTANRLMRLNDERSRQIMAQVLPDGTVRFRRMPDVRQIDYITRALNHAAESGEGAGALGGQTAMGRAYQNLARDMRQQLRGLVPEYGAALDAAAEPIAARTALRFGEGIFSRATTRDDVANGLRGMSGAELTQARAGARAFIDERIANVTRAVTDGNMDAREAIAAVREMSSRANREKMSALIGQQEAARLFRDIDRAATALELRAGVTQNSKTFARAEMDRTIRDRTESGFWNAIRSGEPVNASKRVAQSLLGGTPAHKQVYEDRVYSELAQALTGPRGPQAQALLGRLQRIAQQNPQNLQQAQTIASLLGNLGFVVPAYQTGTQALLGTMQPQSIGPR